ncbi:hypothetical protein HHK36_030319 [Tetracentron sinense]|uniref:Helicase ATP-binding domain-containing protein n=1 Tax=Tetracentron sinense TaxID=13715 RepID=A0A835D1F9_TETSI|nr:hypothetical protein HHK36_030319 [Tetracentron sinense]
MREEEISDWVVHQMGEVGKQLGLSLEGRASETERIFQTIERGHKHERGRAKSRTGGGRRSASAKELRRLECNVNYDRSSRKGNLGSSQSERANDFSNSKYSKAAESTNRKGKILSVVYLLRLGTASVFLVTVVMSYAIPFSISALPFENILFCFSNICMEDEHDSFGFEVILTCEIHTFWQAWKALSCLQVKCRNYLRPGITAPVVPDISANYLPTKKLESSQDAKKTTLWSSSDTILKSSESSRHESLQTHQNLSDSNAMVGEAASYISNSLPERRFSAANAIPGEWQNNRGASMVHSSSAHVGDGSSSNHAVPTNQKKGMGETFVNDIDDDDILKDIDVDQIVLEHYQSTCTPQASVSEHPPITPLISKDNSRRPEETCLPRELCTKCNHGFKIGLCPEAASHLQEMKDMLIAISNELLDNVTDLSPMHIEKLRQERLQLNKQIQQLEKYVRSLTMDEERHKSLLSVSTATSTALQFETPPAGPFRIDPLRFDAHVQLRCEPDSCYKFTTSSVTFPSMDRFDVPSGHIEREAYTPKFIEVNYIEGSSDERWSSRDFPWTKKLEANNKKVFGNHSFRPNQREVINATMSGYDVFVLMPTGGGKSLTYQLPALICPGITLVISPLVSLIQDQIMHLLQANIPAAYLSATMEWTEQQEILRELTSGCCKYKLLYVTPEKVAK